MTVWTGVRWAPSGHVDTRHPEPADVLVRLFSAYYVPPITEVRNRKGAVKVAARSALVRYCGPLGGHRLVGDPAVLRAEAARLLDVADTLEAILG